MSTVKRPSYIPERVLAIDTGLRELGAALFVNGLLHTARLVQAPGSKRDAEAWLSMGRAVRSAFPHADKLRVEMMVVRSGRRDVAPDDLMQLVGVAGVLVGLYSASDPDVIRPEHWKGTIKKRVHHQRIVTALDDAERAYLDGYMGARPNPLFTNLDDYVAACRRCRGSEYPNDPVHNVLDAVGIGLNLVGRL
jgi:hypothetical protein